MNKIHILCAVTFGLVAHAGMSAGWPVREVDHAQVLTLKDQLLQLNSAAETFRKEVGGLWAVFNRTPEDNVRERIRLELQATVEQNKLNTILDRIQAKQRELADAHNPSFWEPWYLTKKLFYNTAVFPYHHPKTAAVLAALAFTGYRIARGVYYTGFGPAWQQWIAANGTWAKLRVMKNMFFVKPPAAPAAAAAKPAQPPVPPAAGGQGPVVVQNFHGIVPHAGQPAPAAAGAAAAAAVNPGPDHRQ